MRCLNSSSAFSHSSNLINNITTNRMVINFHSSSSSVLINNKRTVIFHNFLSPALEQSSKNSGFESPLWVDQQTCRSQFSRRFRIVPRRGEVATHLCVQQRHALFNIDQLRAGPKGIEFVRHLPRGVRDPTDAATLQPFRGALAQQLDMIANNNRWSNFWLSAGDVKWKGFFHLGATFAPPAWKTSTTNFNVWNFSQLETGGGGVDLSTVPVNARYSNLMLGTDLAEQLRNEALRRNLKYPVVCTSKMVELAGCTILPDRIAGFRINRSQTQANQFRGGSVMYNLSDFNVGAECIEQELQLSPVSEPTFAFSGATITRQLLLLPPKNHQSENGEEDGEVVLINDSNNNNNSDNNSSNNNNSNNNNYQSNYWLREFEARQLGEGKWSLKPNARGAVLGDYLNKTNSMNSNEDVDFNSSSAGTQSSKSGADLLPGQRDTTAEAARYGNFQSTIAQGSATTTPYYFDEDIKERKEFLAALGTYIF